MICLANITATCIILRQTNRVVNYIRGVNQKHKSVFGDTSSNQGDGGKKVEEVIKRLHFRANMICIGELGGICVHLVGVFTHLPWYLVLTIFSFSSIGEIGSTLLYKPASMNIMGSNRIANSSTLASDPSTRNNRIISSPRTDLNISHAPTATRESSFVQSPM